MAGDTRVVVFSGGIDSLVCVYKTLQDGFKPKLFYIDFGKAASAREISAVKRVSMTTYSPLEIVEMHGLPKLQNGYVDPRIAAMDELDIKWPEMVSEYGPYASGYHFVLSAASYYAQVTNHNEINIGVIKEQSDALPQLRSALTTFARHIELLNPSLGNFQISTPLIDLKKEEVIKLGDSLKVPFNMTWSCLHGGALHCGVCSQCVARKTAFSTAGVADPTNYMA
jgi:7-cyano-7-deazaguanine synthase